MKQREFNISQIDNPFKFKHVDGDYDEINGWRFQKDRTHIVDNFENGDFARLFNDARFW